MSKLIIEDRFGTVPNKLLNNENMTLKAKGLFAFIQSKPDMWKFSAKRIAFQNKDGSEGVSSALQELEKNGYLLRKKTKNKQGFWETDYILRNNPVPENPALANPALVSPVLENPPNTSKQDSSNKEVVNKKEDSELESSQIVSIIKLFESINPVCKTYYGNKTQRSAISFLLKEFGFEEVCRVVKEDLPSVAEMEYPLIVTNPYELKEKWVKIKKKLEGNKGMEIIVI